MFVNVWISVFFLNKKKLNILKGKTIKMYRDSLENMKSSSPTNNNNKKNYTTTWNTTTTKLKFAFSIPFQSVFRYINISHNEIAKQKSIIICTSYIGNTPITDLYNIGTWTMFSA